MAVLVLIILQGATLIGILAALPKPNPISFRFAINVSLSSCHGHQHR